LPPSPESKAVLLIPQIVAEALGWLKYVVTKIILKNSEREARETSRAAR
jgi:hypothetical protein